MTIISTLSMTKENLYIHLNHNPNIITTGRDEIKGRVGDIFRIEGAADRNGEPLLWVLTDVPKDGCTLKKYAETFYREEGFLDLPEYKGNVIQAIGALKHNLTRFYGDYDHVRIYPHTFIPINLKESDLK